MYEKEVLELVGGISHAISAEIRKSGKTIDRTTTIRIMALSGPAGAGKTDFARNFEEKMSKDDSLWLLISYEEIQKQLFGKVLIRDYERGNFSNWTEFDVMVRASFALMLVAMVKGINVIWDARNLGVDQRKHWVSEIRRIAEKTNRPIEDLSVRVLYPSLQACKERNSKNEMPVDDEFVEMVWNAYREPTKEEGWDTIIL